ncbi:MAG TPA: Uma2 family endonuclease [Xenococcaceae cyanobacterium]|jgi:Uma2 family endonuclease
MLLELKKIIVPPGQTILLKDIDWSDFEAILAELGEKRASRVAYDRGTLAIMTPLPEHEVNKVLITNLVEILLEELDIEFWSLGSTTFKSQIMLQGIEPDNCFYIEHESAIRGKDRLNLTVDPPPDLAIEVEITYRSNPNIYATLGVPELWQFTQGKLQIKLLQNGLYIESNSSPHFPNFPIIEIIPKYLVKAKNQGRNKTIKEFRRWVRQR